MPPSHAISMCLGIPYSLHASKIRLHLARRVLMLQSVQDKICFTASLHSSIRRHRQGANASRQSSFLPGVVKAGAAAGPAALEASNEPALTAAVGRDVPPVLVVAVKLSMHVPLSLVKRGWKPKSGQAAVLVLNSLRPVGGYSSADDTDRMKVAEDEAVAAAIGNMQSANNQEPDQADSSSSGNAHAFRFDQSNPSP